MSDEAASSEMEEPSSKQEQVQSSAEEMVASYCPAGAESSCHNVNDNSSDDYDAEREKSLQYADKLMGRGIKANKDGDFAQAADCFSRALEIKVSHHGELAPECLDAYYKYGRALLAKAQDEADPFVAIPENKGESQQSSHKDGSTKNSVNGDSSVASVTSDTKEDGSLDQQEAAQDDDGVKDQEEDKEEVNAEDLADAEEAESELDLAWNMLEIARAIAEKQSGDTIEKFDILSALAEVSLEREEIETSYNDYLKALAILERIVEPDSRYLAELNFRICLCLEVGSRPQEAIPYCQKAISICTSRMQRLINEVKSSTGSVTTSTASESDLISHSPTPIQPIDTAADKKADLESLTGLSVDLEKKLEDLQQYVSNPTSILTDILGLVTAKAKITEKSAASVAVGSSQAGAANSDGVDSPTVSTAHTNGPVVVTHLGVVGRGVKRVVMNSEASESVPNKRPGLDPSPDTDDNTTA